MGYMKSIHAQILERFPDKSKEIMSDFQAWLSGEYKEPKTKELRLILKEYLVG